MVCLINKLCSEFPDNHFVIIGASNEKEIGEKLFSSIIEKKKDY